MLIASLELAPPVVLVPYRHHSRYVRSASKGSLAVMASLAGCVGVGYVGVLYASIAAAMLVSLCFAATRLRWVRRGLDWHDLQRVYARREAQRQRALGQATAVRQKQYLDLRGLVEGIESADPAEARRLELQELLDHFVQLAVGHQRCLESLRFTSDNESQSTIPISEKFSTKRRHDIAARRLRHRDETTDRLERIADVLGCTDDLIRLVAQRTACANLDTLIDGEGEIDRRLTELDEVEAALIHVSA